MNSSDGGNPGLHNISPPRLQTTKAGFRSHTGIFFALKISFNFLGERDPSGGYLSPSRREPGNERAVRNPPRGGKVYIRAPGIVVFPACYRLEPRLRKRNFFDPQNPPARQGVSAGFQGDFPIRNGFRVFRASRTSRRKTFPIRRRRKRAQNPSRPPPIQMSPRTPIAPSPRAN